MPRLSELHPWLYHIRIQQRRLFRQIHDRLNGNCFAQSQSSESLPFRCVKHQSLLRRKLGESDPRLQENKIINLQIAHRPIDGVVIQPKEIFSFWHLVGQTTAQKGYVEGMQLSRGEVKTGIGGGLCQLANLLYWMALHTPLTVVERHHHSFDPFPDENRTLPFGSGAGIFYNYIDLRFYNPTNQPFQIRVWLTEQHLKGAIYTEPDWPYSYHVFERNHQFMQQEHKIYRANEIWRSQIDKSTGKHLNEELLITNLAEVKYKIDLTGISQDIARVP